MTKKLNEKEKNDYLKKEFKYLITLLEIELELKEEQKRKQQKIVI